MAKCNGFDGNCWEQQTAAGVQKWVDNTQASPGPCATITARYHVPCNIDGAWKAGTAGKGPNLASGVRGKGGKWQADTLRGLARGR